MQITPIGGGQTDTSWLELPTYRRFACACHTATTKKDFHRLINDELTELIPHRMFVCGVGNVGSRRASRCVNVSFPESYLKEVVAEDGTVRSFAVEEWIRSRRPVYVDQRDASAAALPAYREWWAAFEAHGLTSLVGHGTVNAFGHQVFYFSLAGVSACYADEHNKFLFDLIAVHLQHALLSTHADVSDRAKSARQPLSCREQEILKWICHGKSNSEIAQILNVSSWTVKLHVANVLRKLNASNRSHAVAKAVEIGLFPV
jgi:DNA-binding CsgD family transcriptional regulator